MKDRTVSAAVNLQRKRMPAIIEAVVLYQNYVSWKKTATYNAKDVTPLSPEISRAIASVFSPEASS